MHDAAVLTSLGSGGWMPDDQRETSAHLVRRGTHAVLLDAGTGVRRLVTSPEVLTGITRLDIVLSHFHLDHVVGLGYLDALEEVEIVIWGPGRMLYDASTREVLTRLLSPPLLREDPTATLRVQELGPAPQDIGGRAVTVRRQDRHTAPSLAIRLDDDWVYCTDTEHDPGNVAFASGARVLLHEAWTPRAPSGPGHSSAEEAAQVAAAAAVEQLVLVHLPPGVDATAHLRAAAAVFPAARLAEDGRTVSVIG